MLITSYHARYFAFELTRRRSAEDIGKLTAALQDAQVDLNPHQVDAALFAFKSPLSKGALLADEVGLGKTIEAGIILSQKWAEHKRKLLIIAPANLRKQWNQELLDKFFLPSDILESKSFNTEIKNGVKNPFDQQSIVISSFQFIRSKELFVSSVKWDLVIIDEAHRLRNVYKPSNKIANSLKSTLAPFPKVLLTATPLQNSLMELFGLVSIIDDYIFGDIKSFKSQFSKLTAEQNFSDLKTRLNTVCRRTLRRQVSEYINYTNRVAILEEFIPTNEEQKLYDWVSEYLRTPVLYALPASQRHLMTLILRKLLASSSFAIADTFGAIASRLEKLISKLPVDCLPDFTENFDTFDELSEEWNDDDIDTDSAFSLTDEQIDEIKNEITLLRSFQTLAINIRKNAKGEKLKTALKKGFEKLKELNANQKAIIFTESTRTQLYLKNLLESSGFSGKIVLFNGTNNDSHSQNIYKAWLKKHAGTDRITGSKTADLRQSIVDYFRDDAVIMIATEAAAEGINLQFCSLVVNYDLPWNPQRIEQRIGRCHRYGQKFDVVVVNFLNKSNAADQRVYQLLDEKFKLFSGVFGASDEVLGSLESGVDFEKRIAEIYQNCRSESEIKLAFDALQSEMEIEIEKNIDIARKNLLENFDEDVHHKLRISLERGREYLNKFENWLWQITTFYLNDLIQLDKTSDSFVLKENPFKKQTINLGPYHLLRSSGNSKKSEIVIPDSANIYRIGHPLAQQIITECKNIPTPTAELIFNYSASNVKISVLESYVGTSGWLQLKQLTVCSFEEEDFLIFSAISENSEEIIPEIAYKLFSLQAQISEPVNLPYETISHLQNIYNKQKLELLNDSLQKNAAWFDEEYAKLDRWADDMKLSLEKEIKDIDAEIKLRKAEVRKILDLRLKLNEQRAIKDLGKKRSDKRRNLFEAQDSIDSKKENLLSEIEKRLNHKSHEINLFTIKWKIN